MIEVEKLFTRYSYWNILRYFALHPTTSVYGNQLAKELELSTGSCSTVLRDLEEMGILEKKVLGRSNYYNLSDNYFTLGLKRFIGLEMLYQSGLVETLVETNEQANIVLYGSYANGTFDEKSDIDILVLSQTRQKIDLREIETKLGAEVNIETFTTGQWLKMKKEKDPFYKAVKENHQILHGGELP